MSFSALIPVSGMAAANAALAANDWGPSNFSIPVYTGPRPTHATLHAWADAAFQADVEAIPGVIVSAIDGTPAERVADALSSVSGQWGSNAPELAGEVTPGLYRAPEDGELWFVIQGFNRNTEIRPLEILHALVRKARTPGVPEIWTQPRFAEEAYLLEEPFTGEPEEVWREIDGVKRYFRTGINNNATIPGDPSSGPPFNFWIEIDAQGNVITPPEPDPTVLPDRWVMGGGTGTAGSYIMDALVVHDRPQDGGNDWVFRSKLAANTTEPSRDSTFDRWWEPVARAS